MAKDVKIRTSYFELSKHSLVQFLTFGLVAIATGFVLQSYVIMPSLQTFFENFLHAKVIKDGTPVMYKVSGLNRTEKTMTDELFHWAISLDEDTSARNHGNLEAEYIFNPVISLLPVVFAVSLGMAGFLTTLLPQKIGLLRQKIEREIVNSLDKIARAIYGEHTDAELKEIIESLTTSDVRELHDYAEGIGMPYTDLEALQRAVVWREQSALMQIIKAHDGIKFYMRQYFTVQYSNAVLGLVYIGAAVLIIIIGIRGLKFIPPSEPSVILFALGLEFVLLIAYAVTLLYSKQEDLGDDELLTNGSGEMLSGSTGIQGGEDAENLLRAFAAKPR